MWRTLFRNKRVVHGFPGFNNDKDLFVVVYEKHRMRGPTFSYGKLHRQYFRRLKVEGLKNKISQIKIKEYERIVRDKLPY